MHIASLVVVVGAAILALALAASYVIAFDPFAPRARVTVVEARDAVPARVGHAWRPNASAPLVQARRWRR